MKIFVTGADGFIGSHLAERLVELGHDVTGALHWGTWMPDIRWWRGDIRDSWHLAGYDVVFHLAALISVDESYEAPAEYMKTNALGTLNILHSDAGKYIVTSSSEVYGSAKYLPMDESHPINPQSPYAASKVAADAIAKSFYLSYGTPVVTLRPFNTYGPRQSGKAVLSRIIQAHVRGEPVTLGNTDTRRDMTYVSDTVEAFVKAMNLEPGEVVHFGTGKSHTVADMAEVVGAEVIHDSTRVRPEKSEVRELLCDATRFKRLTGWRPQVSLADGIERTIEWFRSQSRT